MLEEEWIYKNCRNKWKMKFIIFVGLEKWSGGEYVFKCTGVGGYIRIVEVSKIKFIVFFLLKAEDLIINSTS